MLYLADTNILLRMAEPTHSMHADTLSGLATLRARGETMCVFPQNVIEFWNVATRPAQYNGLGFTHQQAQAEVEKIERLFQLILDVPAIYAEWKRLVLTHAVTGKQVHDARIAAALTTHGITHLLTFNTADFKRFTAIVAVSPAELLPPTQPAAIPTTT
ncbi:MAG: type II toxin-antitoxin system VapC family toxin [Acidobacteriota bacterium]